MKYKFRNHRVINDHCVVIIFNTKGISEIAYCSDRQLVLLEQQAAAMVPNPCEKELEKLLSSGSFRIHFKKCVLKRCESG